MWVAPLRCADDGGTQGAHFGHPTFCRSKPSIRFCCFCALLWSHPLVCIPSCPPSCGSFWCLADDPLKGVGGFHRSWARGCLQPGCWTPSCLAMKQVFRPLSANRFRKEGRLRESPSVGRFRRPMQWPGSMFLSRLHSKTDSAPSSGTNKDSTIVTKIETDE